MSETAPVTWPRHMRRAVAAQYLRAVHGIDLEEKTLRNRHAAGLGPRPEYLGTIPYYRAEVLDEFAETAFTAESPVTVTRRRVAQAEATRRRSKTAHQPAA